MHSKRHISISEGHFGVKTIMAAILKWRSKPMCSITHFKGPFGMKDFEGYDWWTLRAPWSFAPILCMMTAPPYYDAEGHFKKHLFGPLQQWCPILLLAIDCPAKFSSNCNQTHLKQLIKIFRNAWKSKAGVFDLELELNFAGQSIARSRIGHPCPTPFNPSKLSLRRVNPLRD